MLDCLTVVISRADLSDFSVSVDCSSDEPSERSTNHWAAKDTLACNKDCILSGSLEEFYDCLSNDAHAKDATPLEPLDEVGSDVSVSFNWGRRWSIAQLSGIARSGVWVVQPVLEEEAEENTIE